MATPAQAPSPLGAVRASIEAGPRSEEQPPNVPWYKRDISFKRKKKDKKEKIAPSAEAPEPAVPESTKSEAGASPEKKVPWYKRDISFGGKSKSPKPPKPSKSKRAKKPSPEVTPANVPPAELPPVPAAETAAAQVPEALPAAPKTKVPWYKREISLGGKPKRPKEPKLSRRSKSEEAALAEALPAAVPPVEEAPAASPEAALVETEAPEAPTPKVPWYKRDISFGGGKSKSAAAKAPAKSKSKSSAKKSAALRQKALVGVKIGASGISAARVVQNGGRTELLDLAREPLPRGVVVAGEVRDVESLATSLANMFDLHNLPKKAVRLGVSNNRIGVRIIEVSGVMQPEQLENAIRFRAQEVLPIALEDAVLDYRQLSEGVNAEGELVRRILLVVAYRDLIDRYVIAFKEAGVRLVGIDLEAFGLLRALPPEGAGERGDAAHVVVSIGHERSTFAVSDGEVCEFTRVLEWGGSTLDIAIARQLNLAPSEAEPIKHVIALDGSERSLPPNVTQEQASLAADVVRRQLQTFARELVSSLQYYQNQPNSLGIGDIVLSGGTSLLPGLAAELQRLIGVSVKIGDPFERVKIAKGVEVGESQRALATAIGLAIEE